MKSIKQIVLIVGLLFITSAAFADIDANLKETFDVGQGGTLFIESDFGTIEVVASNNNGVQVQVFRSVDAFTTKEAEQILERLNITFDKRGNDVYVKADYDHGSFNWNNKRIKLKFVATVPKVYNVDLKTSGGSISVSDLDGKAISKTSGGGLHFGNINGPVIGNTSGGGITMESCVGDADVKTSGGGIKLGKVDGNIEAHTSGGSVTIEQAKGVVNASTSGGSVHVNEVMGRINASTSGGSINARITAQPESECRLTTSGGSVNVDLLSDIKAQVDASTSGGKVYIDFPVTVQGEISARKLNAEINGGGPLLYLRTSGGNINIKKL